MATLTVGPDGQFSTVASAVSAAQDGDTIDVEAGTYTNDFIDTGLSLTLQAVGGPVVMVATEPPPDDKAMITEGGPGTTFTINGFDISGVTDSSSNGAGVRYQGGTLNLNNDYIHNNQDGLLGAADPNGTITINDSEFANNGNNDGTTHNIYAGQIAQLTVENSYIHDANGGHEIKSRALNTTIENNQILDPTGNDSYSIDIPQGGNATITGNTIEQGGPGANPTMIAYGEEGSGYGFNPGTSVTIADNTILNDIQGDGYGVWNATGNPIESDDNQVYGLDPTKLYTGGPVNDSGTTFLSSEPALNTASSWSSGIPADPNVPPAQSSASSDSSGTAATATSDNTSASGAQGQTSPVSSDPGSPGTSQDTSSTATKGDTSDPTSLFAGSSGSSDLTSASQSSGQSSGPTDQSGSGSASSWVDHGSWKWASAHWSMFHGN